MNPLIAIVMLVNKKIVQIFFIMQRKDYFCSTFNFKISKNGLRN